MAVDKPSVVPSGTRLHSDQPYPGLGVLGYFHAVPSGLPGTRQSFRLPQKPNFPLGLPLQAAFGDPLVPVTASVGVNYDLQSEMAYRIQDHWYVGGFLAFNNTRDYATQSGGFFVRYLFRPEPDSVTGSIGAFPRQGFRAIVAP